MNVGVVGTGVMGRPMAERLLHAGHSVWVHNRTRGKAEPLLAEGARWADQPAQLAAQCDVVLSMVTDPAAVEQVSLGPGGIIEGLCPEAVHCDMSTVAPASAAQMAAAYCERGRRFVQAPVLGSRRQIEQGVLLVFGGGAPGDVAACERAWSAFASRVWRLDAAEKAAALKLSCNMLIAHMVLGLGQSLLFGASNGVAPETVLEVLSASAMACPMFASKGKTLLAGNFEANFYVRHMLKDLSLAADAGRDSGAPAPFNALAREIFVSAVQQQWGDLDYSAAIRVLEQLAGHELGPR